MKTDDLHDPELPTLRRAINGTLHKPYCQIFSADSFEASNGCDCSPAAPPQEETDVEGLLKVAADVSDHLRNWCGDDYAADVVDRLRTALRSTRAIADEKYAACEIIDAKRHEIANQRDALRCESDATIAGLRESFWNLKRALDSETDLRRAAYADRNAARSSLASLREQVAELSRYPLGHIEVVAVDSVLSLIDQAVARTIQKEEGRDGL